MQRANMQNVCKQPVSNVQKLHGIHRVSKEYAYSHCAYLDRTHVRNGCVFGLYVYSDKNEFF